MRLFLSEALREALLYSQQGGQALHLHRFIGDAHKAPRCFVNAVNRGEYIAHLFDLDKARLVNTAKRLGVRVLKLDKEDTLSQHVDLCGAPLRKALWQCVDD
jgi:hypothetical protein